VDIEYEVEESQYSDVAAKPRTSSLDISSHGTGAHVHVHVNSTDSADMSGHGSVVGRARGTSFQYQSLAEIARDLRRVSDENVVKYVQTLHFTCMT
jgi:hypothetical protein